jgi:two-component system CheB/CheR fusion protein
MSAAGPDHPACPADTEALAERLHALWWSHERSAALLLLDEQGTIVGVRAGPDEVLGHAADTLVGRPLAELFTPEDRAHGLDAHERDVALSRGHSDDDRWMLRADGTRVWTTCTLTALRDEHGRCIGFAKLLRERGDLRAQFDTLAQRVALLQDEKDRLWASVGLAIHELANPLSPLSTAVRMLPVMGPEKSAELLQVMERQVAHMKRLLDDLRRVQQSARAERVPTGRVQLQQVVDAALREVEAEAAQRHQCLHRIAPEGPLWIEADAALLQDALVQLLRNALQHSDDGAEVLLQATPEYGQALLQVIDHGLGLDGESLVPLQQWLVQQGPDDGERPERAGMGLALLRRLARLHHGSVELSSAGPGQGTEVRLRLPLEQRPPPEAPLE